MWPSPLTSQMGKREPGGITHMGSPEQASQSKDGMPTPALSASTLALRGLCLGGILSSEPGDRATTREAWLDFLVQGWTFW